MERSYTREPSFSPNGSKTFDCGIFSGEFGTVFRFKGLGKACPSPHHALHSAPVGVIADQPFHDQRLPLHVDRNLRAGFEMEPLTYRLRYGYLPFR